MFYSIFAYVTFIIWVKENKVKVSRNEVRKKNTFYDFGL